MNETYKIADFIGKELPPEILEQLKIVGRVKQFLKPTSTSAISQAEDQPEISKDQFGNKDPSLSTERDIQDEISKLIDEVKDFEDQVEQLEDLVDDHLKDMAIPPINDMVADAVNQLGGDKGIITKDVLDRAMAIMDYFPIMSLGQDPVLAALTGDGTLTGPYLQCNEITSSVGKDIQLAKRGLPSAEVSIKDQSMKIADNHDKRMKSMLLEIVLNLWWNILWTKFVVDMNIINPLRQLYANQYDSMICFFKVINFNGKRIGRFRRKPIDSLQGTEIKGYTNAQGPINKLLNKIRTILLCRIPPKFYKNYKPYVVVKCPPVGETPCPNEPEETPEKASKNMSDIGEMMDDISDNGPCFNTNNLIGQANSDQPSGFGSPPECVKAAKVVLDAVIADALTPPDGSPDPTRTNILGTGVL